MRRPFLNFFRFLTILLLIAGGTWLWMYWQQRNLSSSSSELAINLTQEVLTRNSAAPLLALEHPRLLAGWNAEGFQSYIGLIPQRLGTLQALTSISGGITVLPVPFLNREIEANYSIGADFSEAAVTCQITLIYQNGRWLVADFVIESPLMSD
jgi:hypothetical protein